MRRFHKNTAAALGAFDLMHGAPACGGGAPKSDRSSTPSVTTSPTGSPSSTSDGWKNQYNAAQSKAHDALRRSIISAVALGALALTAAACGGDAEPQNQPTTSPSPTSSSTTTATTVDPNAWQSKFTSAEIEAYDAALGRWTSYERRSEPIWAKGKATPAAEALFRDYWIAWQPQYNRLKIAEENGITVSGLANVLSSKATTITLSGTPRVVIEQCIDPTTITVLPATNEGRKDPYLRTITLDQPDQSKPFKVASVGDITNQKKVTSCER